MFFTRALATIRCRLPAGTVGRVALRGMVGGLGVFLLAFTSISVIAETPQITARRALERKTFTDAQITEGFFKIAFGAEFHIAGRVDRIRKYDGPVRVYVDSQAKPDRRDQVAEVVA